MNDGRKAAWDMKYARNDALEIKYGRNATWEMKDVKRLPRK